jgi:hypothetical protein
MIRRNFLTAACALLAAPLALLKNPPRVFASPVGNSDDWCYQSAGRNTGRTMRGYEHAIAKMAEYGKVVFVVSTVSEANRLASASMSGKFDHDGAWPEIVSCERRGYRGRRAHFVLDHSVWELPADELWLAMSAVEAAHVGEWPIKPAGVA